MSTNGYWVILEIGQGSGVPNHVLGPYWDETEAEQSADTMRAEVAAVGRRDRFYVGVVDIEEKP